MYYLYIKKHTLKSENITSAFLNKCSVKVIKPNPFKYKLPCEGCNIKLYLSRLYFWIITGGKYKIYYLCNGIDVAHYSYLIPKCSKFPFMRKEDYEIGPCVTATDYRRKGCYHFILNHITSQAEYQQSVFYMIVKKTNEPSIKGIEKSGFNRDGSVRKTRFLKRYVVEK